jgi:hypothetical protein
MKLGEWRRKRIKVRRVEAESGRGEKRRRDVE